jgi:dethiobiotin synthetase
VNTSRNKPFDFDVSRYGALPRLEGLMVIATDTGVGKTMVAGAIARTLLRHGRRVEVFKPAATGCKRSRGELVSDDADFLAACAESRRPLAEIAPVRYAAALAPNVAAEREHRPVDLEAIFAAYRRLEGSCDTVIVEGVGGLLCPLSDDFWIIHLAKMLKLPVVIVARPNLGTINHTLLTLQVARSAGLDVLGVVINRYRVEPATATAIEKDRPGPRRKDANRSGAGEEPAVATDDDLAMYTNPLQIARRGNVEVLAIVPDDPESSVEKAILGNDVLFAVGQVDWQRLIRRR